MSDESKRAAEGIVALLLDWYGTDEEEAQPVMDRIIEAAYADRIADLREAAKIGLRYAEAIRFRDEENGSGDPNENARADIAKIKAALGKRENDT